MATLKGKTTSFGLIEVRQESNGWYALYINGQLKTQSADLNYILQEYDRY